MPYPIDKTGFSRRCGLFIPRRLRRTSAQSGSVAIMFAACLMIIFGFCGFSLDLSRMYNRKVEVQNMADAVALAAAQRLNGTAAGVNDALVAAAAIATSFQYQYTQLPVSWDNSAITFSTSPNPNGTWVDSGTASATPGRMFYARVDTSKLAAELGKVEMYFMPMLSSSSQTVQANSIAIAGRSTIDVTPLAICAMSSSAAAPRNNSASYIEVVEYGFRRGVSYDLMKLNPNGTGAVNYVVNPIAAASSAGSASDIDPATVGPYACAGSMSSPALLSGTVRVGSPFPLGSLYTQLNSRFDVYTGNLCDPKGAPPDKNIKEYAVGGTMWMSTATTYQRAMEVAGPSVLHTVADLPPPGGTAAQYGPVWAYAKAAVYSASPPVGGYTAMPTASWPTLYNGQATSGYPAGSTPPYKTTSGTFFQAPSPAHTPAVADRRVLYVPLLQCPVPPGANVSATVYAIGKFFMTVRATATSLPAEFAGAVPLEQVTGGVELYQ